LLALRLRWLELRDPGLATGLRAAFDFFAPPFGARKIPRYLMPRSWRRSISEAQAAITVAISPTCWCRDASAARAATIASTSSRRAMLAQAHASGNTDLNLYQGMLDE
jgi:hypothetical protein